MNAIKLANPITVAKGAFDLAGTAVRLAGTVVRVGTHVVFVVVGALDEIGRSVTTAEPGPPAPEADDRTDVAPGPTIVLAEPHAPEEPIIDVVGEALAAETAPADEEGAADLAFAHEPRGASRDEEHGEAELQRAEVDEIDEEVAAALEGDIEPEEHLTQPLLDPADVKAAAAELQTMTKAADPQHG
jgi:cell division septation protein DedD